MDSVQSSKAVAIQCNSVTPRFGSLKNANSPGDPSKSPRCNAKTRAGTPCRAPAMWSRKAGKYTRCRMHGGRSTGPRSPEGLERCRKAALKHGRFSAEYKQHRREIRAFVRWHNAEI